LLVMRHSKTEPSAATDHVRRLTERGRRDARSAGAWVAASAYRPDLILSSTAARAEETAEVVAALADVRRVELVDALYGADAYAVLEIVAEQVSDDVGTVLVVGHNPTMAQLGHLLQSEGADEVRFPTSGIGVFGLDVASWADVGTLLDEEGHGRVLASYTPKGYG
ncbi:MAG TPA: histidine phosphatase family protein, partial [Nocardioidaceae bacterium]